MGEWCLRLVRTCARVRGRRSSESRAQVSRAHARAREGVLPPPRESVARWGLLQGRERFGRRAHVRRSSPRPHPLRRSQRLGPAVGVVPFVEYLEHGARLSRTRRDDSDAETRARPRRSATLTAVGSPHAPLPAPASRPSPLVPLPSFAGQSPGSTP